MIFKTFDSDIDKWTAKIGIFGKSFNELGTAVNDAFKSVIDNLDNFDEKVGFWESLKNNLFSKKREMVSQLIDVMPEINSNDISDVTEEIKTMASSVSQNKTTWQEWFDILPEGKKHLAQLGQQMEGQIITTEGVVKANQKAREAAIAHNAALKQQTLGAKAATVATKALAVAGNMLLMWAISAVISKVVESIDDYIHRVEKIKEAAQKAKSAIDDIKSEFDTLNSTTNDVKERFAELAQGVANLGKVNQSRGILSTEDYADFLDLSNQLAELFPQLTKGYDDNGNAILDLSGNVDTIVGALDKLVSVQQKLANQEILEKMPDVWAGYTVDLDEYTKELENAEKELNIYQDLLDKVSNADNPILSTSLDVDSAIGSALRNIGIDSKSIDKLRNINYKRYRDTTVWDSTIWDFSTLTESQLEQLKNTLGSLGSKYEDAVQLSKGKIESANSGMSSYINTWLSSEWNFSKMDANMQHLVKDVLLNSDWLSQLPNDVDSDDWDEVSNWLQQKFLYAINKIDSEKIQDALTDAFNGEFTSESLREVIKQLLDTKGFEENNPLIVYLQTKLQARQDTENAVKRSFTAIFDKDGNHTVSSAEEKEEYDRLIAYTKDFSEAQWEAWLTSTNGAKSAAEAIQKYEKALEADSVEPSVQLYETLSKSAESASDTVSTLRSSISFLNDAFAEQKENGSISVDTMLSLVDTGYATALSFDEETGACRINTDAMLGLAKAKLQVQIADLESLKIDIANKLKDEGLAANEAANGYLNLAKAKLTSEQSTAVSEYNNASAQMKALQNVIDNLDNVSFGNYSSNYTSKSNISSSSSAPSRTHLHRNTTP